MIGMKIRTIKFVMFVEISTSLHQINDTATGDI